MLLFTRVTTCNHHLFYPHKFYRKPHYWLNHFPRSKMWKTMFHTDGEKCSGNVNPHVKQNCRRSQRHRSRLRVLAWIPFPAHLLRTLTLQKTTTQYLCSVSSTSLSAVFYIKITIIMIVKFSWLSASLTHGSSSSLWIPLPEQKTTLYFRPQIWMNFYRTQVYLGSESL